MFEEFDSTGVITSISDGVAFGLFTSGQTVDLPSEGWAREDKTFDMKIGDTIHHMDHDDSEDDFHDHAYTKSYSVIQENKVLFIGTKDTPEGQEIVGFAILRKQYG